jgi:hypothetical protein
MEGKGYFDNPMEKGWIAGQHIRTTKKGMVIQSIYGSVDRSEGVKACGQ